MVVMYGAYGIIYRDKRKKGITKEMISSIIAHFSKKVKSLSLSLSRNRVESARLHGFTIVELLIVVVVIAILAAITIVSYNGITSQARESARKSDLATWKKKSEIYKIEHDITCPDNWVFVYGNPAILGSKDFCVMKYEAKIQGQDNGNQPYSSAFVAESRASGTPWTNISQTNAIAESAALGDGTHLITETEWMTLAADVLSVKYNWSGGAVGSGFIYSGHNDNSPANPLAASTDDEDGYVGTGNQAPSNQRRTLYLKSGDVIWDMAGNVYDWTSGTITGAQPGLAADEATGATYSSKQWNNPSMNWGTAFPVSSRPSALAVIPELGNINAWDSTRGIGQLHSNQYQVATRGFLRGGAYTTAEYAGVLMLKIHAAPSGLDVAIGFRAAR